VGLDFTDGLFPITCYVCTIEQGPLQSLLSRVVPSDCGCDPLGSQ